MKFVHRYIYYNNYTLINFPIIIKIRTAERDKETNAAATNV